jgi:epoxyqueuosine reductase
MISSEIIKTKAKETGFTFCGIAKVQSLDEQRDYYTEFIKEKRHLSLAYLETNLEKRLDPRKIMCDARSVIALLVNYYPGNIIPEENNFVISKYAYGKDYQRLIKKKIDDFVLQIKEENKDIQTRVFVDSGAVLEKVWAQKCGVGWQGKNTLLINKSAGSFFFIGIILTDIELEPDKPEPDHCRTCTKCQDACPTGALSHPYQLDISRCISFHTIENKKEIPEELKDKFHDRIFGCDICQDVCPYNKFAVPHYEPDFSPAEALKRMRKADWLKLTEDQFNELFHRSPVMRTGYRKLMSTIREISGDA